MHGPADGDVCCHRTLKPKGLALPDPLCGIKRHASPAPLLICLLQLKLLLSYQHLRRRDRLALRCLCEQAGDVRRKACHRSCGRLDGLAQPSTLVEQVLSCPVPCWWIGARVGLLKPLPHSLVRSAASCGLRSAVGGRGAGAPRCLDVCLGKELQRRYCLSLPVAVGAGQRAALVPVAQKRTSAVVLARTRRKSLDVGVRVGLLVHVLVGRETEHGKRLRRELLAER